MTFEEWWNDYCEDEYEDRYRVYAENGWDAATRADPAWAQDVRALLAALESHESRENEILTRALDGSVEAQD